MGQASKCREYFRGSEACRNSDLPDAKLLVTTTISIVLATTMVVGTAMEKIATALAVIEPVDPNQQLDSLSEPLAGPQVDDNIVKDPARIHTSGSRTWALPSVSWTLPALRFHSRGHLYQAFARFDLEVLQPTFGGPCRARGKDVDRTQKETFEMPKYEAEEEDAPLQSRAVIFE